jgi:hypothetical protein
MLIEMLRDFRVAPDGIRVETWMAESVYDADEQLARDLVNAGVAKEKGSASEMTPPLSNVEDVEVPARRRGWPKGKPRK